MPPDATATATSDQLPSTIASKTQIPNPLLLLLLKGRDRQWCGSIQSECQRNRAARLGESPCELVPAYHQVPDGLVPTRLNAHAWCRHCNSDIKGWP